MILSDNIRRIQERIIEAALTAGRDPASIKLIAVSKVVSTDTIRAAAETGLTHFGESYMQEAIAKIEALNTESISWHFIGHLQSNKAKYAVRHFDLIHSVDAIKLAKELDKEAGKNKKIQEILLQVNMSGEPSKYGADINRVFPLVEEISRLKYVAVKGLMTMPPFFDDPKDARPYFKATARLKDEISRGSIPNISMHELSMGMTGDFEVAISEGATMVRIGTAIFGSRT